MNAEGQDKTTEQETDSDACLQRIDEHLPRQHRGVDDAGYIDWLKTILLEKDLARVETAPLAATWHPTD